MESILHRRKEIAAILISAAPMKAVFLNLWVAAQKGKKL